MKIDKLKILSTEYKVEEVEQIDKYEHRELVCPRHQTEIAECE